MSDAKNPERTKLSVSLALDGLSEVVEEIGRLEARLVDLRAVRDDFLIDAYGKIPINKLARLTGLSRERVGKIASGRTRGV